MPQIIYHSYEMTVQIKRLGLQDWKLWKQLRLEALQVSPENFRSSYEEESNWSDAQFQNSLLELDVFAAFVDGEIAACATFNILELLKTKHRGMIRGLYTKPKFRGNGIAKALMEVVIAHAKERVVQLHLNCVVNNNSALGLYQKYGFRIYGTEPRTLKSGDEYLDEHMMVLDLLKNI